MNIVTINTDAGFYPFDKVGSYAYWIKGTDLFLSGSGLFKNNCTSPTDAEYKAVINALHILLASGYKAEKIIINRDNIHVKSGGKGNKVGKMLQQLIRQINVRSIPPQHKYYASNKYCEFRHVKAHSTTDTARSWVNDWCDKQCRMQLRKWKEQNKKQI